MTQLMSSLMNGLIDYAGLFPPARLPMENTVQNYASYRNGEHRAFLGRLIVPLARLEEFDDLSSELATGWELSVIGQASLSEDLEKIASYNDRSTSGTGNLIVSLERRLMPGEPLPHVSQLSDLSPLIYLEIAPRDLDAAKQVAEANLFAKVRMGGIEIDAFPSADEIATFIETCVGLRLPFKATAGLHHPIRSRHRVSNETDAPAADMHGFVNLLVGTSLRSLNRINQEELVQVLSDVNHEAFSFEPDYVSWNNYRVSQNELDIVRKMVLHSIGSCSFVEPIDDLQKLGLMA